MKFKEERILFLIGAPASGKDTQGKLLAKKLKAKFCVTSSLIDDFLKNTKRKFIKIGNKLIDVKKELEKKRLGFLVASEIVIYVVIKEIQRAIQKKEVLVISGSPRMANEAKSELYFLKKNCPQRFVFIFLDVPQKEIFKRTLKRKREDDHFEIVKKRIDFYKKNTLAAIKYLKRENVIIKVKGVGTIKDIHKEILLKVKYYFKER